MSETVRLWLRGQGLMVKPEFVTPWGICDFVAASFDCRRVQHRLKCGQRNAIGPASRVDILHRIPGADTGTSISLRRIEREFQGILTPEELHSELENLLKNRFIRSPRRNHFQYINGWYPLHKRIVAVELKLNRIREALHQAALHLKLTPETYVGLPIRTARRLVESNRREEFIRVGVGILSVNQGRCRVLLKAGQAREVTDPVQQMHCVERFWRSYVRDSSA